MASNQKIVDEAFIKNAEALRGDATKFMNFVLAHVKFVTRDAILAVTGKSVPQDAQSIIDEYFFKAYDEYNKIMNSKSDPKIDFNFFTDFIAAHINIISNKGLLQIFKLFYSSRNLDALMNKIV